MLVFQISCGYNEVIVSKNISGIRGSLASPGYPGNYPNNVNYTWILNTGQEKAKVTFQFDIFDIFKYKYSSCNEDFLEITVIDPCCFYPMRRCGRFGSFPQIVKGRLIRINFVSDERDTAKGFSLKWKVSLQATTKATKHTTKTTTQTKKTTKQITKSTKQITKYTTLTTETNTQTTKHPEPTTKTSKKTTTLPLSTRKMTMMNETTSERKSFRPISRDLDHSTTATNQATADENTNTGEKTAIIETGIAVIEITLVAVGIYIFKHRRDRSVKKSRDTQDNKSNSAHTFRKSTPIVDDVYESIPLEHFKDEDNIQEKGIYMDAQENIYDKAFERRPHVIIKNNVYSTNGVMHPEHLKLNTAKKKKRNSHRRDMIDC
ncbi:uncharacterized protein LOC134263351 isoform X2 [Saccostrea cucullata]|uniref:uncharacterized protein LOC134263351 isoform X2 n=1 Tax=Saccostrea cuccullata TaxID=36930 RepID=UPI002ED607D9